MDDFTPRRTKQVIDDTKALQDLLDRTLVGYLGLSRDGEPYVVPVAFARRDDVIVIHSAAAGKKIAFIRANPQVCLCAVPHAVPVEGKATFSFESVIVYGRATLVEDREEKRQAYLTLVDKYEPAQAASLSETCIDRSAIIAIRIGKVTGKRGARDA